MFRWTFRTGKYDPDKKKKKGPDFLVCIHSFGISLNVLYDISNELRAARRLGDSVCAQVPLKKTTGPHFKCSPFFPETNFRINVLFYLSLASIPSITSSEMHNECERVLCDAAGLLVLISTCEKAGVKLHNALSWRLILTGVLTREFERTPTAVFGTCDALTSIAQKLFFHI